MRRLKELWRDESGAMAGQLPFLVAGVVLVVLVTGVLDDSIRTSGLAWAEQLVHRMGF